MTLQDIIAIAGLSAAVFSAVAAAFAVKQSKLQRTTLTKPQLIVSNIGISVERKPNEVFSLLPKDDDHLPYFQVPIKNVGLGTALNLKYSWDFDYTIALDACGFSKTNAHQMGAMRSAKKTDRIENSVYVEENEKKGYSFFSFFKNGKYAGFVIKKSYIDIEYIIPITQDKNPTLLTLPYLIPILTFNNLQNFSSDPHDDFEDKHLGTLRVYYEDISGCSFNVKFSCKLRLIKYTSSISEGIEAVYELNLSRVHKTFFIKKLLNIIDSKFILPRKRF